MAIVALALWTLTIGGGVYLLVTSTRRTSVRTTGAMREEQPEPVTVPPAARLGDRFDPLSLREAKNEPIPGLRALGEFTHPALAIIGFAFWMLYTMIHSKIFGSIALGILLGAIAAGIAWALANSRAVRKDKEDAMLMSGRALLFHGIGAALTLIMAALLIFQLIS